MIRECLLGILLAVSFASAPALAETHRWTLPTEYPATSMPGEGIKLFAEVIGETSAKRIAVTPSFDAALGLKSGDMIKAVSDKRVVLADAFAGALGDTHPMFLLSSLPFLAVTIAEARLLADVAKPSYGRVLDRFGQKLLFVTPWPASGIWAKKPIAAPSALTGLAIRTYDATSTALLKAAGAAPAQITFADAMTKLRDGSVQAVLSSGDGGAGRRLWELLNHFTEINYAMPLSIVTMDRATFNALPPDLRQGVEQSAAAVERRLWRLIETRLEENYSRMRANGVSITTQITPELGTQLSRAATSAIEEWSQRAGPEGVQLLAEFRRRAGKP